MFTRYAVNTTAVEVFKRVNTAPQEVLIRLDVVCLPVNESDVGDVISVIPSVKISEDPTLRFYPNLAQLIQHGP